MRPEMKEALRGNKGGFLHYCRTYFGMSDCSCNKAYRDMKRLNYRALYELIGTKQYEDVKEALTLQNLIFLKFYYHHSND